MKERQPRWLPVACLILSLLGLAVSIYLTIAHYASPRLLACSATGIIDCEHVTTSRQSMFLGIPVALLGLLFYIGMVVLNLLALWRSDSDAIRWGRLAAIASGMVFVMWLLYAELFIIRAICLWCTVVHVITFVLFCLILYAAVGLYATEEEEDD